MRTLVLASFVAMGCYNPSFTECTITCGGMENKTCPSGFSCDNGYCRSAGGSCGGPGSNDGSTFMPDADPTKYQYRKLVTIEPLSLSMPVIDFPVLVKTTDPDLMLHAQADGEDIAFGRMTGTEIELLPFEIEKYESASGRLVAWVQLPDIDPQTTVEFYMLYGNESATSQQKPSETWDGFAAVWHLSDPAGTPVADSTGTHAGTRPSNGPTPISGLMNGGFSFLGRPSDYFEIPMTGLPASTMSLDFWIFVPSTVPAMTRRLLASPLTFSPYLGVHYYTGNNSGTITVDPLSADEATGIQRDVIFSLGIWHHVMTTWNVTGGEQVYFDGALAGSSGPTPLIDTRVNAPAFVFGGISGEAAPHGTIDEVRLSTSVRSPAYARATYEIGNSGSTVVRLGPELASF